MSEVLNIKSPKRTVFWLLVFLFPPTIGLGLVYYSAAQGLTMGFTNWNIISAPKWIGLKNFEQIWNDYRFWLAVSNTLFIVLVTVPAQIGLGLLAAVLLHRIKGKTSSILRFVYFYPTTCSVVALGLMWMFIYDSGGLLNQGLEFVGLESVRWLGYGNALLSVCVLIIWTGFGYISLIYVAGLAAIPEQYYEAAHLDGANSWQQFFYITLPMLTPTTFFLIVVTTIGAMQTFGQVYIINGRADSTLTIVQYIYEKAFTQFSMGYAAALSWILISFILILTVIQVRLQRYWVSYDI